MAAGDYTIALTITANPGQPDEVVRWTVTLDRGDVVDPGAAGIGLDPLDASWSMPGRGYPSQPEPVQLSFGLYVPNIATGPEPAEGDRLEVTITTPDTTGPPFVPVLDFVGTITDADATVLRDGVRYAIVAVETRAQLGDERLGDEPWPAESRRARLERLVLLSGQPLEIPAREQAMMTFSGLGPDVAARDVDSQTTTQLLDELLGAGVTWAILSPAFWITGYIDGTFRSPRLTTWLRPIVSQSVDALGNITFPIVYIPGGGPDLDAALPYTIDLVAGALQLQRKAITPTDNQVCWIPADAVQLDSVKWRQDKATNTNRARVTAPDIVTINLQHTGSLTAQFDDLVEKKGPNEVVVTLDAAQTDYVSVTDLLYAVLGRYYDAVPRWTLDTFTILPEQIAAGDQWPRLFNPREHVEDYDQAAGRFVLITDIDDRWNLGRSSTSKPPDFWGRLAGATLRLDRGKIRMTATLAHRLPWGMGRTLDDTYPEVAPTHHPITYAELNAIRDAATLVPNAHFPADVAGYTGANAVLAWTIADGADAAGCMIITAIAAGNAIVVDSGSGAGGIPVTAGEDYYVTARGKAVAVGRTVLLRVDWWNAAGVFLSTSTILTTADVGGVWSAPYKASVRAPAGAAFARRQYIVAGAGAGEVHRLDDFTFTPAMSYAQAGDLTPADLQLVEG